MSGGLYNRQGRAASEEVHNESVMDGTHDWTATLSRMKVGERNGDRMLGSMCRWYGSLAVLFLSHFRNTRISYPPRQPGNIFKACFIYLFVCV